MSSVLLFKENPTLTMGVELELQLVNLQNFNLTMEAEDFLRRLTEIKHAGEVKPEITQSMVEINSSIHTGYDSLLTELCSLRDVLVEEAAKTHIGICGGGTHPFQKWKAQRIFESDRFASVSAQYGYLAKQFTIFGQHIHIGCVNGDDALYLCHALAHYIPQFIALSAASPFNQGIDTFFDCSRLAVISAFPLSGTPPWVLTWGEFQEFYEKMLGLGIISSMKDFYWDIRPKPEYGTIELRICDTPLTVTKAAQLAAYMQILVKWLLASRPMLSRDIYLTYLVNRFRAARYGLEALIIDPVLQQQKLLAEEILNTCSLLESTATELNATQVINQIRATVLQHKNGASWLREKYQKLESLNDVVRMQTIYWKEAQV